MFWIVIGVCIAAYLLLLGIFVWGAGVIAKRYESSVVAWHRIALCTYLSISAGIFAWSWFVSPLPSDNYMIEHFKKNRAAYEELVAGYIDVQSKGNDAMKEWHNNPRTIDLQRIVMDKIELNVTDSSQSYRGISVNTGVGAKKNIVHSIDFSIKNGYASSLRHGGIVWKEYRYYANEPELTDDGFCKNTDTAIKCLNKSNIGVLGDLDHYPTFPESQGGCGSFVRQIDAHWFIRYVVGCM